MNQIQSLLIELHTHLNNLESILEDKRDKLCDQNICTRELECVTTP